MSSVEEGLFRFSVFAEKRDEPREGVLFAATALMSEVRHAEYGTRSMESPCAFTRSAKRAMGMRRLL